MAFQIFYDDEKKECVAYIPKTGQQIKQVYWKIEITDENGNTVTIQRKKERKPLTAGS
jgi:uncharacterized protein YnzC (UPF0291/DUF896 family)